MDRPQSQKDPQNSSQDDGLYRRMSIVLRAIHQLFPSSGFSEGRDYNYYTHSALIFFDARNEG